MNKFYYPLVIALFYLPAFIQAQAIKGFKLLEKNKPEKAEKAFNKAIKKASQKDAAVLGLYKVKLKDIRAAKNFRELIPPYEELTIALEGFKSLPANELNRFKKKGVYTGDFQTSLINLQSLALNLVLKSDSILALDHFKESMGQSMTKQIESKYQDNEKALVVSNYLFEDYQTLLSITKQHPAAAIKQKLSLDKKFIYRVLYAFCRNYSLSKFPSFCKDLPDHWSCHDCHWQEFNDSLSTKKLSSLLNFLYDYRLSNLDQIVLYALEQPINADLVEQANSLDSIGLVRWNEIRQSTKWMQGEFPAGITDEALVNLLKNYLPNSAPSNRSYWVLLRGLEWLHERQSWALAADLTRFAQPLYPYPKDTLCVPHSGIINKDSLWFGNTIHAFSLPSEQLKQERLSPSTKRSDHSPVLKLDGSSLFFAIASEGEDNPGLDVYCSEKIDTSWSAPKLIPALSGKEDQIPLALALHGNLMLLSADKKLCLSARGANNQTWTKPKPVSDLINNFPWIGRGTLSENGEALIFEAALDSFPFLIEGNVNLYLALYDPHSKSWSAPMLLNAIINTPWHEGAPYLHIDGETLYFRSYGHFGLAEQDLFMSTRLDSTWLNWSVPKPIGKHLNTFEDDFAEGLNISTNGLKAYFSGKGINESPPDLYAQELPSYARPRRIKIINGQIEKYPKVPWVKLMDAHTNRVIDSTRATATGEYLFLFAHGTAKEAIIFVDDPELYSTYVELNLDTLPDLYKMPDNPITAGIGEMIAQEIPVPLRYLEFSTQSDLLSTQAQKELNWMTRFFLRKRLSFLLAGYADKAEEDAKNLSMRRAKSIKAYLGAKGLVQDRMWLQDFGENKPAISLKNKIKVADTRHVEVFLKN